MAIVFRGNVNATGNLIFGFDVVPVIPVDSVSAGSDQIILCAPIIYLEGSVVGGANNVFLWEQISGTPVTIVNETQLNAYFLNTAGGDLIFRLWVDKNTVNETYDDTSIVRTPSEWVNTLSDELVTNAPRAFDYDEINWKYYAPQRNITNLVFTPDQSNWPDPSILDDGIGCPDISPDTVNVNWNLPVDNYSVGSQEYSDYLLVQFVQADLEKYNTGTLKWEVDQSFVGEDAPRTASIEFGELYRLVAVYDFGLMPVYKQYTAEFTQEDTGQFKTMWDNLRVTSDEVVITQTSIRRIQAKAVQAEDEFVNTVSDEVLVFGATRRLTGFSISGEDEDVNTVSDEFVRGPFVIDRNFGDNIGGG